MSTKRFALKTKIYDVPEGSELRRIRRPDGISFVTSFLLQLESEARPVSVEVDLRVTIQRGTLLITMRRIARRPDSWYCSTSSINLPPRAATDLIQSLTLLTKRLKH